MLLSPRLPHAVRQAETQPGAVAPAAEAARREAERRAGRTPGLLGWAVHAARDGTRVVTLEAWRDAASFRADADMAAPGAGLYAWVASDGAQPLPVAAPAPGIMVIDVFAVWRPLARPVSAVNARNGSALARHPGCIGTLVLRGAGHGRIATCARWQRLEDFLDAFGAQTGRPVRTLAALNAAAAGMTLGFIRPDYHDHELVACGGDVP